MALFPSLLWPDPGPRVSTRGLRSWPVDVFPWKLPPNSVLVGRNGSIFKSLRHRWFRESAVAHNRGPAAHQPGIFTGTFGQHRLEFLFEEISRKCASAEDPDPRSTAGSHKQLSESEMAISSVFERRTTESVSS